REVARGYAAQSIGAVVTGDRVVRVRDDTYERRHPRMDVALDAHEHFGLRELAYGAHALVRHADVEALGLLGQRVHVVQRLVAVAHLQRLGGLYGHQGSRTTTH